LRSAFKNKAAARRTARISFDDDAPETVCIKDPGDVGRMPREIPVRARGVDMLGMPVCL
jgi:hypothetical protein